MKIENLTKLLPEGYEQACFDTKAIERKKIFKKPIDLIKTLIYYFCDNHSLLDVCQFVFMSNIGKISDVAFLKKLVKCNEWLKWLIENITPNQIINYDKPAELEPYQVIAIDASDITQKGAVKKIWRLHYAVDLFSLTCNQFKITEQTTGESLKNFEINKKHLIIADRGYGSITGIEHCLNKGGNFILRIKNKAFNLYNDKEEKIILSDWLKTIGSKAAELNVYIKGNDKKLIPLRICAIRKTDEEILIEEKRLKRAESKRQITYSDDTKYTHQYMFVITSLPESVSAEKVLDFYRLRWQVELVFKRYKSLLGLGNIPTKTKETSEVWLNGKMFLALLIEKYLGDIDFSPSWNLRKESEYMAGDENCISFNLHNDITQ